MNIWIGCSVLLMSLASGNALGGPWGFFTFGAAWYVAELTERCVNAYRESFEEDHFGQ